MPYTHLTPFDREKIELLKRAGNTVRQIADEIERSPSTVARELARNRDGRGRYRALKAQMAYRERRLDSVKPRQLESNPRLRGYVEHKLREDWSPEQIAETLPLDYPRDRTMRTSHETIYTFVYADKRTHGTLYTHLRRAHRKRRRRSNTYRTRGLLPGRVGIEKRPKAVETRRQGGHWEADLVLGRQGGPAIATLVERKTGLLLACKVQSKRAYPVGRAIVQVFHAIPDALIRTITFDNGKEFADFKSIEQDLNTDAFFADPYAAWQRGTNENTNGLLRQYVPKKSDLRNLLEKDLQTFVRALNNRPRKRLNYRTPAYAFNKEVVALQL